MQRLTEGWRDRASLIVIAVAVSCAGEQTGPATRTLLRAGPFDVERLDLALVDGARPIQPSGAFPGAAARDLKTTFWYPATRGNTRLPVVVYSHGGMSFPTEGRYLTEFLASHGYLVVAPKFPLSSSSAPGRPMLNDVVNQPGDVSFLISSILDAASPAGSRFANMVDPQRIAAVGLSLGGTTTLLVAFHPRLRDARIRAAVSIAGPNAPFEQRFFASAPIPLLAVHGDQDAIVSVTTNATSLRSRAPSATIVILRGGSHAGFAHITRWLLRWVDHPDRFACWNLKRLLSEEPQLGPHLGSARDGVRRVRAHLGETPRQLQTVAYLSGSLPCSSEELPRALRPGHQQLLAKAVVFAFLQSQFALDPALRAEAKQLLAEALPGENEALIVQLPQSARGANKMR